MSWTDERIALLKKMWKEGKSAADIAKMLGKGVTRNAVIGKAHRMGLSGRPSPIKKPAPAAKAAAPVKKAVAAPPKKEVIVKAPAKKIAAPVVSGVKNNPLLREPIEPKKPEKEILPLNGGVALIDLSERMCKWPIGDPRDDDFTFCGRPIRQGTPYCQGHSAMAYQTSSRGRQQQQHHAVVEEKVVEDVVDDDEAIPVT